MSPGDTVREVREARGEGGKGGEGGEGGEGGGPPERELSCATLARLLCTESYTVLYSCWRSEREVAKK